jgi:hypothetical protein
MEVQTNLMPRMPSQNFVQVERIWKKCRLIEYLPLPPDMAEVIKSFLFYGVDAFYRKQMKQILCDTLRYNIVKTGFVNWRQHYEWDIYERYQAGDMVWIMWNISSTTCIRCGNYKDMEEIPVSSCIKCNCDDVEDVEEEDWDF